MGWLHTYRSTLRFPCGHRPGLGSTPASVLGRLHPHHPSWSSQLLRRDDGPEHARQRPAGNSALHAAFPRAKGRDRRLVPAILTRDISSDEYLLALTLAPQAPKSSMPASMRRIREGAAGAPRPSSTLLTSLIQTRHYIARSPFQHSPSHYLRLSSGAV